MICSSRKIKMQNVLSFHKFRWILWPLFGLLLVSQQARADLVPFGAEWRYLDNGLIPQSGWQNPSFDDSAWNSGVGQFGYGDGDEATLINYGADSRNKPITSYFRHQFDLTTLPSEPLRLNVQRDAGIVVYLNGEEIFRDNMRDGFISDNTVASGPIHGTGEAALQTSSISPQSLLQGSNTLAVEVHLASRAALDLSFDLQLTDNPVVRGPYLQTSSSTGITVRWRTETARDATLRYGTNPDNLDSIVIDQEIKRDHTVVLTGLNPDTRYYYSVGDSSGDFTNNGDQYFDTHPVTGSPAATRIWVLGDSGTADAKATSVRNAFTQYNGGTHSDVLLMLGDNAYESGEDVEYQAAVFDMFPRILRNSVVWPTLGNHDAHTADSDSQSGPYYDIFTLPTNGESGGVASGTEAYYSFDYGNIHFVSLDSHDTNRSANGAMATWLENDLAANTQEWIIAFWHHPPYSKGSHDSDSEWRLQQMRENIVPILESHGVDLVLGGHSHSYERSMLINGHYGTSDTFSNNFIVNGGDGDPNGDGAYTKSTNLNSGAVYTVAGNSGQLSDAPLDHPVMISNLIELGSLVIDVEGDQLDLVFLNNEGAVRDSFRIVHQSDSEPPTITQEIDTDILDHDRVAGSRWTRMNFEPQVSGMYTISLDWAGSADIRFTLFRVREGASDERIATINQNAPAEWSGTLVASERYYLGVWAASGSASVTATLEAQSQEPPSPEPTPEPIETTIAEGTLDSTRADAPRWVRLDFTVPSTGVYNIAVPWTNNNADVRYRVNNANGTNLSPTIRGENPGVWQGLLEANTEYFIGLWSTSGVTNYNATISTTP